MIATGISGVEAIQEFFFVAIQEIQANKEDHELSAQDRNAETGSSIKVGKCG